MYLVIWRGKWWDICGCYQLDKITVSCCNTLLLMKSLKTKLNIDSLHSSAINLNEIAMWVCSNSLESFRFSIICCYFILRHNSKIDASCGFYLLHIRSISTLHTTLIWNILIFLCYRMVDWNIDYINTFLCYHDSWYIYHLCPLNRVQFHIKICQRKPAFNTEIGTS